MKEKNVLSGSSAFSIDSGESRWVPLALHATSKTTRSGSPIRVRLCLVVRKKSVVYKQWFQLYIHSKKDCRNVIKWSNRRKLNSSPKSLKNCPVKIELGVSVRNNKRTKQKKFKKAI